MTISQPRLKRALTILIVGFFVAGSGILASEVTNSPVAAEAADLSQFDAGSIISDAKFFDGFALSTSEVQTFLNGKVASCTINNGQASHAAGAPYYSSSGAQYSTVASTCLKDYTQTTPNMVGQPGLCSPYTGRSSESAASIIANIGEACNVSQKVLLVLLEKEQSLVRDTWPLVKQYDSATGFACYDNGQPCVGGYAGFFYQVWAAALQFQRYGTGSFTWYPVGQVSNILYQANNAGCGTRSTYIANRATAALYYYTPYTPNAAALAAGYGLGDACSAYGNRNFFQLYVDWFGSTQGNPEPKALRSTSAPTLSRTGAVLPGEILTSTVSGWDAGVAFAYQWLRDGAAISGATNASYTTVAADNGAALRVMVTGSKSGFVTSNQTSVDTAQVIGDPAEIAASAIRFHAILPARITDTRVGGRTIDGQMTGTGSIGAGQVLRIPISGRNGIPASGVGAVSLNVTVVSPTSNGHVTVFPTGTSVPNASNVNFRAGQVTPNAVFSKIGSDGSISVFNSAGNTNIIVDVNGWYPTDGAFTPTAPARILDTRAGQNTVDGRYVATGAIGAGQSMKIAILGRNGLPTAGVDSVSLNVTAVTPAAYGHLTVYPTGTSVPNASNLNFYAGTVVANAVIAKVGADGSISVFNSAGSTDVVIDITGWYPTTPAITTFTPARILDTRAGQNTVDGRFVATGPASPGQVLRLPVLGRAGVPATGVGAVSVNVTAVTPSSDGNLTIFPSGFAQPPTSNLNFRAGQVVSNAVIAKVGADGTISIFNSAGNSHIIVDINGWFPQTY
jgi:hypothetical protein